MASNEDLWRSTIYNVIDHKVPHNKWNEFVRLGLGLLQSRSDELSEAFPKNLRERKYQEVLEWRASNGYGSTPERFEDIVNDFLRPSNPPDKVFEESTRKQPVNVNVNVTDQRVMAKTYVASHASIKYDEKFTENTISNKNLEEPTRKQPAVHVSVHIGDQSVAPSTKHAETSSESTISSPTAQPGENEGVGKQPTGNAPSEEGTEIGAVNEVEQFIVHVNKGSEDRCQEDISKSFDGKVRNPKRKVNPVMAKSNFFSGGTILGEKNYAVHNERETKIKAKRGKEINTPLEGLHIHGRYIFLVGSAGSGKTTLVQRYVLMVMRGQVETLKEVKMAHLINIRDVSVGKVTTKDMLFNKFIVGEDKKAAVDAGYKWLQKESNQRNLLLAFDGLDTVPWDMSEDKHKSISYDDEATADTIMFNILKGHLFKNCWILVTAREYAITRFPRRIRPDAVVVIKGLTRSSIETLIKELPRNRGQGEEIWEYLRSKSSYLMLLCANPLFLILTVIMRMAGEELPENISGTILTLIQSHLHSENAHIRPEDIDEILEKLEELSLLGLQEGRVVFSKAHFDKILLEMKDAEDLFISAPMPEEDGVYKQKIVEKDYAMFFCHQAFQEALGALAVTRKRYKSFEEFVDGEVHKVYFTVVRQMLCGILFGKKVNLPPDKYRDLDKKRSALLKSFEKELQKNQDSPMALLNLLISLRECGETEAVTRMVRKCLPKIDISGIPLNVADMHAIASMARQCDKLDIMKLVDSHLSDKGLEVLADEMSGSDVEITVFDVSFNANLRKQSMANLYEICRRGYGLNYWQCGFKQRDILDFNPSAPKVPVLDIDEITAEESIRMEFEDNDVLELSHYNVETHRDLLLSLVENDSQEKRSLILSVTGFDEESSMEELCHILGKVKSAKGLVISHCVLDELKLEYIKKAIRNLRLEIFNIFLNEANDTKCWNKFGNILTQCGATVLFLTACSLTKKKLDGLLSNARRHSLDKLDVSRNYMDPNAMEMLGDVVATMKPKELIMGYCEINSSAQLRALRLRADRTQLQRLDMSGNDKMGEDGFKELGMIIDQCQVQQLDASECDPSAAEMRSFKKAASNAKLLKLNVSRNRNLGDDGLQEVGEIGRTCRVEELFVRQCGVKESSLLRFKKGLGEAKIASLDFGRYFMKHRETTSPEVKILADLLDNVTEKLTLNDWDIMPRDREYLIIRLKESKNKGLKVVFNRGRNDVVSRS